MRRVGISAAALLFFLAAAGSIGLGQTPPPGGQTPGARAGGPPPASLKGTGLIVGQVVDAGTGKPLPGVVVTLGGGRGPAPQRGAGVAPGGRAGGSPERVIVDPRGRFVFRELAAGSFTLTASKSGYVGGGSGQRVLNGQASAIDLGDGERLGEVTLRLWKLGAVSGTVVDDAREPMAGVRVLALRRTLVSGRRRLTTGPSAVTDDRGVYRIGRLSPGEYILAVGSGGAAGLDDMSLMSLFTGLAADPSTIVNFISKATSGRLDFLGMDEQIRTIPTTFFAGASAVAQAVPVVIGSGDERLGIDFHITSVRALRVSGIITDSDGRPVEGARTRLVAADAGEEAVDLDAALNLGGQKGHFEFLGVAPGRYVLHVIQTPRALVVGDAPGFAQRGGGAGPGNLLPTDPTLWAAVPVLVQDKNITLPVKLREAPRIRGRIEFDGTAARPAAAQLTQLALSIEPVAGPSQPAVRGRVNADATFMTIGVTPGKYLVRLLGGAAPWVLKSIVAGTRDISDLPIEIDAGDLDNVVITLTDRPLASLSGTVRTAQGAFDANATVLMFPTDRQYWTDFAAGGGRRLRSVATSRNGAYSVAGLPAGEYFVVAAGDTTANEWQDPKILEGLARTATRIQIADNDRRTLDLRVTAK